MNSEVVIALVNILDPFGIYEVCPEDEYKDIAYHICKMVDARKNEEEIASYIAAQYINGDIPKRKVHEFIRVLGMLM